MQGNIVAHNCLALGYGMGPKKMVKQCYDNGYTLDLKTAREFFDAYWQLFSGVKRLGDRLETRFKRDGYLVNPFGYRLVPDKSFKALNYFIQSSVSGILHVYVAKLMALAPWCHFLSVIHDELLVECPVERLEEFRGLKERATQSLNEDLNWTVDIRVGFSPGQDWYSAK